MIKEIKNKETFKYNFENGILGGKKIYRCHLKGGERGATISKHSFHCN